MALSVSSEMAVAPLPPNTTSGICSGRTSGSFQSSSNLIAATEHVTVLVLNVEEIKDFFDEVLIPAPKICSNLRCCCSSESFESGQEANRGVSPNRGFCCVCE
jgi:hypothetical protein